MKLPVFGLISITTYSALHTFRENRLADGTCLRMHWVKVHVASPCSPFSPFPPALGWHSPPLSHSAPSSLHQPHMHIWLTPPHVIHWLVFSQSPTQLLAARSFHAHSCPDARPWLSTAVAYWSAGLLGSKAATPATGPVSPHSSTVSGPILEESVTAHTNPKNSAQGLQSGGCK